MGLLVRTYFDGELERLINQLVRVKHDQHKVEELMLILHRE